MNILKILLTSILSITELFILTKIIGNRQMSELNMFDYINGITIGSIAAEMATSLDTDKLGPMIAMAVYGLVTVLLSWISSKSIKARRLIVGKSIILFKNGNLYKNNMKVAKLDINELTTQCRVNGYFDFSEIDTIILESNGKVAVQPKAQYRPVTPFDLSLTVQPQHPQMSIIIDGNIMEENLKQTGKNIAWVQNQLRQQHVKNLTDVFYASYDSVKNSLNVYEKLSQKDNNDIFI